MLETDRLWLRPFAPGDYAEAYRLNDDPEVMRFLPKDEVFPDMDAARVFMRDYVERARHLPYARCAVIRRADGAWLGWSGLKLHADGETDLGYRFHRAYWGEGYATEAGRAWLRWAFAEAGLKRVVAQTTESNYGSRRVLEKLGFGRIPDEDYDEDGFRWVRYGIGVGDTAC